MYVKFLTEVELSVVFEGDSIAIYEGDSTEPEKVFTVENMVEDFLDMVTVDGKVCDEEKSEAKALLKALKNAQVAIETAL